MQIEHVGLNVPDPRAMADWYVAQLGFTVRRKLSEAPWTHFLADAAGRVMVEIYHNVRAPVPDYARLDPLVLHLAFSVADVATQRERLMAAGARAVDEVTVTPAGDTMAMLRDPWGVPIQLVKRAELMVG